MITALFTVVSVIRKLISWVFRCEFRACKMSQRSTGGHVFMQMEVQFADLASSNLQLHYLLLRQNTMPLRKPLRKPLGYINYSLDYTYSISPPMPIPIRIRVDSTGAIKPAQNSIESDWTKHFDIHYHLSKTRSLQGAYSCLWGYEQTTWKL